MEQEHYKDRVVTIITEYLPCTRIYLFGSRARAKHKSGADIDLALDARTPIALTVLGKIQEALEESSIPVSVDVIDIHAVSPDFVDEIKKDWIIWYLPKI